MMSVTLILALVLISSYLFLYLQANLQHGPPLLSDTPRHNILALQSITCIISIVKYFRVILCVDKVTGFSKFFELI